MDIGKKVHNFSPMKQASYTKKPKNVNILILL